MLVVTCRRRTESLSKMKRSILVCVCVALVMDSDSCPHAHLMSIGLLSTGCVLSNLTCLCRRATRGAVGDCFRTLAGVAGTLLGERIGARFERFRAPVNSLIAHLSKLSPNYCPCALQHGVLIVCEDSPARSCTRAAILW